MTIKIHEASPRALKQISLEFADGSSLTGKLVESSFTLVGPGNWRMIFSGKLNEVELRAPFEERLGLLASGSLTFRPLQDGYIVESS
jgi:hypothetical protein